MHRCLWRLSACAGCVANHDNKLQYEAVVLLAFHGGFRVVSPCAGCPQNSSAMKRGRRGRPVAGPFLPRGGLPRLLVKRNGRSVFETVTSSPPSLGRAWSHAEGRGVMLRAVRALRAMHTMPGWQVFASVCLARPCNPCPSVSTRALACSLLAPRRRSRASPGATRPGHAR